jgi:hypothetical protein
MKKRPIVPDVPIPLLLNSKSFRDLWATFVQHRSEKRAPLTLTAARMQLARLEKMGVDRAMAALQHSIENGWTGVFEPKDGVPEKKPLPIRADGGW